MQIKNYISTYLKLNFVEHFPTNKKQGLEKFVEVKS